MSQATDMRDAYLEAELALLKGKEVSFGDRRLRREDLPEIRAGRIEWERRVATEQSTAAGIPPLRVSVARMD